MNTIYIYATEKRNKRHSKLFQIKCFNLIVGCFSPPPPHDALILTLYPPPHYQHHPDYFEASTKYANYYNRYCIKIPFHSQVRESQVRLYSVSAKIQSSTKVLARLPTFAVSVREIYQFVPLPPNSMLFIAMNWSLLVSNIVGGKRVPYSSDSISYCFQNSLSTHVPVI